MVLCFNYLSEIDPSPVFYDWIKTKDRFINNQIHCGIKLKRLLYLQTMRFKVISKYFETPEFEYQVIVWTEWTKFLLAIVYVSPRRHPNDSKTFEKKLKYIFVTILGLAETFDTDPARPWHSLTAYFSESKQDRDMKFWDNLDSSFQFVLLK